ncbi:hypothetical protein HED60_13940 [Planctomycetales bacterium ZRK34]|nr:hypothetical protein HED60_13940 [Planctomycetales bacterium ZRK34]
MTTCRIPRHRLGHLCNVVALVNALAPERTPRRIRSLNEAEEWEQQVLVEYEDRVNASVTWTPPFQDQEELFGNFLRFAKSGSELTVIADKYHNCARTFVRECREGAAALGLFRPRRQSPTYVFLIIPKNGYWQLVQLEGKRHGETPEDVVSELQTRLARMQGWRDALSFDQYLADMEAGSDGQRCA